jgi:pyoverdine/dityrosine biosynthesis protein Dit1/AcrR family transcriptional regulator
VGRGEQTRSWRSRLRVLEAAVELFGERGYDATSVADIARRAKVSVGLACRYFPTKEHFALALYGRLADDLAARAVELADGTVADRFAATLELKLALLEPHRRALVALAGRAIDPDARAGVLGDAAEPVRSQTLGVFALVVRGATDTPATDAQKEQLARVLYAAHLGFVFLWLQTPPARVPALVALARELVRFGAPLSTFAPPAITSGFEALFGERLRGAGEGADERARTILRRIFTRRRVLPGTPEASDAAYAMHLPRVRSFVERGEKIVLVLPAFPAKSSSAKKTLGPRGDAAEHLALESLASLLDDLEEAHPPGAELVICSDGHVFADVVGVRDADCDRYRADLEAMLLEIDPSRVRFFDLRDAFGDLGPAKARAALIERYAMSVDAIRERAERSPAARAQVDGIHRFLFEDEHARRPSETKNKLRKETRPRAYEVVRRSDAWGRLVADAFPRAVRLSIHPQPDISDKIGVHLIDTDDAWLTPWHAVAVLRGDQFVLMHRADAEALGATIVEEDGRPSYLTVAP